MGAANGHRWKYCIWSRNANSDYQNWEQNGLEAHSAPVDDNQVFQRIMETDQAKSIY
ncbi:MAG: hypothetical protein N4A45_12755 [Flavobacteriales bacterium]|nr:hypothetical protein [Flavobacteriales bacterium]